MDGAKLISIPWDGLPASLMALLPSSDAGRLVIVCHPLFTWLGLPAWLFNGLVPILCCLHACDRVPSFVHLVRAACMATSGVVPVLYCLHSRDHVPSFVHLVRAVCMATNGAVPILCCLHSCGRVPSFVHLVWAACMATNGVVPVFSCPPPRDGGPFIVQLEGLAVWFRNDLATLSCCLYTVLR